MKKSFDLFLTHAWRYHEDWTRATSILDRVEAISWRNFSVPWHDPAMDMNTEVGGRFIREWLETQIMPVDAVLLLAGVYALGSGRKWVELELEYAHRHRKLVLGLPALNEGPENFPEALASQVVAVVSWDAVQIIAALDYHLGHRK